MSIAPGDHMLLEALYENGFLSSGQLARWSGRSSPVIRRRMRKLQDLGFVIALKRSPTDEATYALGPMGRAWMAGQLGVEEAALPMGAKVNPNRSKGLFFEHEILVGDILIAFRKALASHPKLELVRAIREWERANPKARSHHEKYLLSERFKVGGKVHMHRPDACLLIRPKTGLPGLQVAVFVEADRSTESMKRIGQKLDAYYLYWRRHRYQQALAAVGMRVCFVLGEAKTEKRIQSMQRTLAAFAAELREGDGELGPGEFARLFRFARREALEGEILKDPVWYWGTGTEPRPFVQEDQVVTVVPEVASADADEALDDLDGEELGSQGKEAAA